MWNLNISKDKLAWFVSTSPSAFSLSRQKESTVCLTIKSSSLIYLSAFMNGISEAQKNVVHKHFEFWISHCFRNCFGNTRPINSAASDRWRKDFLFYRDKGILRCSTAEVSAVVFLLFWNLKHTAGPWRWRPLIVPLNNTINKQQQYLAWVPAIKSI